MPFRSILFDDREAPPDLDRRTAPECFADLNLDLVVASVTLGRDEYGLKPFFYVPLDNLDLIAFRHEVLRDLEDRDLLDWVGAFAGGMRSMRAALAQAGKLHYALQKQRWFLEAAAIYCDAVTGLDGHLADARLRSRGLLAFRDALHGYLASPAFTSLRDDTHRVTAELSGVRYCLDIRGNRIRVTRYDGQSDYGAEVLQAFEKFKRTAAKEYRFEFSTWAEMNHVEAAVLERVAGLHPEVFTSLDQYCARHRDFADPLVRAFDREVQFYVACREYVARLTRAGLSFCYPRMDDHSKAVHARDAFDLALAGRLLGDREGDGAPVVTNDFELTGPERILVVSGPNQGGKTTFARMFGQLHYLASLGWPVPGTDARLFLFDRLYTHFEQEEDLQNLSGKLEGDLRRIHAILAEATSSSIVVMNESFSATTTDDALVIGRDILEEIIRRDMLGVSVTFLDELASLSEATVSMVSGVDARDAARRTFKVLRRPADGRAYAWAIAEKYGLTYNDITARLAP